LDGTPVHEALSEANLVLGGLSGPSLVSAGDLAAALFVADYAFQDGLLPSATFVNGDVFTPSSYLAFPSSTTPAAPEPSTWAMMLVGFAALGFASWRSSQRRQVGRVG